jgi:hypothetical protein
VDAQAKPPASWDKFTLNCDSLNWTHGLNMDCAQGLLELANNRFPFSLAVSSAQLGNYQVHLKLKQASFSDSSGLHAGEKLDLDLLLDLQAPVSSSKPTAQAAWLWQASLDWSAGELLWQPVYLAKAGLSLTAHGSLNAQMLDIQQLHLGLPQVGQFDGAAHYNRQTNTWQSMQWNAPNLQLAGLYPLVQPVLQDGLLGQLEIEGQAGLVLNMQQGEWQQLQLRLDNVDMEDKAGRFAMYKLQADIPWDNNTLTQAKLQYAGARLLKIPLGATHLQAQLNGYSMTAPEWNLPIFDGALHLQNLSAARVNQQWYWHVAANIVPIDMLTLSQALGWPSMQGKVAATIPMLTYANSELTVDGAMGFNVFNGSVLVDHLSLQQPLGKIPKLYADIKMRQLDMGALTRTFSFGAIEGKLDGDVEHLQLTQWRPTNFDARFSSSPGSYPKKISQRAVENISALGGAGAAAAIQRSFLRFLKEFNYEKLGLSCQLRGEVCHMDGVETTAQGYIIVKGSGIPSMTVMGYNHTVSWSELLARIQRVIAGNGPVIQ